jgi:hypothetical protein
MFKNDQILLCLKIFEILLGETNHKRELFDFIFRPMDLNIEVININNKNLNDL